MVGVLSEPAGGTRWLGLALRPVHRLAASPATPYAGSGAGAGLAACGVLLQVLLRNPLASPYTPGVGSASALGASLVSVALPTFHVGLGAWLERSPRRGS